MAVGLIGTGLALTAMGKAIIALYGISKNINEFMDDHIASMKNSDNLSISRVGSVLEGAKFGFGLGYLTCMIVMAGGQLLLGNTLAAAATVTTLTNPIAMTCAAVGAIYFGWTALKESERDAIVEKLVAGFEVGSELVRAIFGSILDKFKAFAAAPWLGDLRAFVGEAAGHFGKKFSDISGKVMDKAYDFWDATKIGGVQMFAGATAFATDASERVRGVVVETASALKDQTGRIVDRSQISFGQDGKRHESVEVGVDVASRK